MPEWIIVYKVGHKEVVTNAQTILTAESEISLLRYEIAQKGKPDERSGRNPQIRSVHREILDQNIFGGGGEGAPTVKHYTPKGWRVGIKLPSWKSFQMTQDSPRPVATHNPVLKAFMVWGAQLGQVGLQESKETNSVSGPSSLLNTHRPHPLSFSS